MRRATELTTVRLMWPPVETLPNDLSVRLVQIVAGILEGSISTAGDVARLAGVCRSFQRVLRRAPLRVQLPRASGHPVALPRTRKAIACLRSSAPGAACRLAVSSMACHCHLPPPGFK